jgi:hypothetical protein
MVFGFDLAKIVKEEILKVDIDKKGGPDALQALDGLQAGIDKVQPFLNRLDEDDVRLLLQAFNVGGKFTPEELDEFAEGVVESFKGLAAVKNISEQIETELKKKK